MSAKRWVVFSVLGLSIGVSCAEEDQGPGFDDSDADTSGSGGSSAGHAGTKGSAGSTTPQGGKAGSSSGGKSGASSGGATHAGTANAGGSSHAGSAGTGSGGGSAGSSTGGTGSTVLGCLVDSAGGAAGGEGGGASAGAGQGASGGESGGAPAQVATSLFFDDFESNTASAWTTSGGMWAIVDDGTKVYEQALLENKLQIASASGTCFADQVVTARVKVTEFKGQSNSYVAALFGRVLGPQTHYLLALGSDKKLILRKRIDSTSTSASAIGSAAALTVTPGQWYDVRFELIGTSLKGCVGEVCVAGTDSSIASGGVAVGTVNTSARFDDVRVTAP